MLELMINNVTLTSFLICFIPLVTVYFCFMLLDKKFSWWRGIIACLCGLISVVPIAAIQFFVDVHNIVPDTLSGVLLSAILLNGLIEESVKMAFMFCVPAKKVEQREFFIYGVLCGLSLGCFESLVYLISGYDQISLRMLTAVVIHICCAGLSSLMVYSCKNCKPYIAPFIIAILLHGVYNYFAGFSNWLWYFSIAVILVSIVEAALRYRKLAHPEET